MCLFLSTTYLVMDVPYGVWCMVFYLKHIKNSFAASLLLLALILTSAFGSVITTHTSQAETGKGEDIFRIIMTIFGVDKSKGDVVAIVTLNDGEASRVKFLDTEAFVAPSNLTTLSPSTTNPAADAGIIEYVATFPNVTVNAGEQYEACVVTTKDLELICKTGLNSPAARPEFIDISLNTTAGVEQVLIEDEDNEER
jgi:hypothetical protein